MIFIRINYPILSWTIFWSCLGLVFMGVASPYKQIQFYLYLFLIGLMINIAFQNIAKASHILQFGNIIWYVHLILILYLIIFTSKIKGSWRWLYLGGISYQPSEGLKLGFILLASSQIQGQHYLSLFCSYLITILLLFLQPDLGSAIILSLVLILMLAVSKLKKRYLLLTICSFCTIISCISLSLPHSRNRILNYLDRQNQKKLSLNKSYQNLRALGAIQNGGIYGLGLGKGTIKMCIPDAYSDFIFAVLGEELGIIGLILIIASFLCFILFVLKQTLLMNYSAEQIAVIGLVSLVGIQSWIHFASCLWIIPTKGTTLPFISHGGSSALTLHMITGIICNFIFAGQRSKATLKLENV